MAVNPNNPPTSPADRKHTLAHFGPIGKMRADRWAVPKVKPSR
jgi:hypothetical protein